MALPVEVAVILFTSTARLKKIAAAALGLAALTGLGITGYKCGWLSPKFAEEKKHGNLSCVG